ncbi:MAG: ATP-binding protein [Verrucomicrobiales bacterium]|nr:ATP-binding protein [Verrucomicrobiales bacterium]
MSGQYRQIIESKILEAIEMRPRSMTRREATVPSIKNKAICVIGMRRAGKTTFLHQCRLDLIESGISARRLVYFNFEDERLAGLDASNLSLIPDCHARLFPEDAAQNTTLFLDEIQRVSGWEVFARRMMDSGQTQLFLSGSSAKLLSREIATSMRGRAWEIAIYPFSFGEFLIHHGIERPTRPGSVTSRQATTLDHHFLRYLNEGGFPEAQGLTKPERNELLQGYVDVVLLRDVIERHGITNATALRQLVLRLLASPAGMFSVQKFFADMKSRHIAVSRESAHEMLAHLEDAFLLQTLPVASDSVKRQQVNPRKCYPVDPALIHAFDRSGRPNTGHALESVVFVELMRRKCEVGYVKTASGYEVDFLARDRSQAAWLIQVCASVDDPATLDREVRALKEAIGEHPGAKPLILTLESRLPQPEVPKPIHLMPAWQWLLS